MARPKKTNHPISIRLEQEIYDKLNQFCDDAGQSKTVAVERALEQYINDYYDKQEKLEKLNRSNQ